MADVTLHPRAQIEMLRERNQWLEDELDANERSLKAVWRVIADLSERKAELELEVRLTRLEGALEVLRLRQREIRLQLERITPLAARLLPEPLPTQVAAVLRPFLRQREREEDEQQPGEDADAAPDHAAQQQLHHEGQQP